MKQKNWLLLLSMLFFILSSCKDEAGIAKVQYDPSKPVTPTSFSPERGRIAEQVILTGSNFGSDISKVRVWFNKKRGKVIGSNGSTIYVICPRTPGDTCTVSVVVESDSVTFPNPFYYTSTTAVSTIAGTGDENGFQLGTLATAIFQPNFLAVDKGNNIFVVSPSSGGVVLKVNEAENSVASNILTNSKQSLFNGQTSPCIITPTQVLFVTARGGSSTTNWTCDPKQNWVAMPRIMDCSDPGQVWLGDPTPDDPNRVGCAYCESDDPDRGSQVYIPYWSGEIYRIDPVTQMAYWWERITTGDKHAAFHPINKTLMYLSIAGDGSVDGLGMGGRTPTNQSTANSIWCVDVKNYTFTHIAGTGMAGHKDGDAASAMFDNPSQIAFDKDGSLYIADKNNHCIRKLSSDGTKVETVIGIPKTPGEKDGSASEALLTNPTGIAVANDGTIYIADKGRLRKLAIE